MRYLTVRRETSIVIGNCEICGSDLHPNVNGKRIIKYCGVSCRQRASWKRKTKDKDIK